MYKVIVNNNIVDLLDNVQYVCFLPTGHIAFTDKCSAQGFLGSDGTSIFNMASDNASLEEITIKEFNELKIKLANSTQAVALSDSELSKIRENKIAEMSQYCQQKIIAGFSTILANGQSYHFNLTIEDQLNLRMFESQLQDKSEFIYHATSHSCEVFSREDMKKIIDAANRHILFHTTYFNCLKAYINELVDVVNIKSITYGINIAEHISDPRIQCILEEACL